MRPLLLISCVLLSLVSLSSCALPNVRPAPADRKFNSTVVNRVIDDIAGRMADRDLAQLFSNCLPCTLDTTVESFTPRSSSSPPDAYVITGDINAQWLRDSTNQVLPYIEFAPQEQHLQDLICGLILRQAADVSHDPYANAFNYNASGQGHQDDNRKPPMTPLVFEGKYELDSLAAAMKLSWHYFNATQDDKCFLSDNTWLSAMKAVVATITAQQQPTVAPRDSNYVFQRTTNAPTDSLMLGGVGNIGRYTGMSRSAFRPSDDSTLFPHFVPANAMAVVELRHLSQMLGSMAKLRRVKADRTKFAEIQQLRDDASALAEEINAAIRKFGIVNVPSFATEFAAAGSRMFAYEVDGYGGQTLMDDANIPSLLALPYLGYLDASDPVYQTTRAFLLSTNNPYYFQGSAGEGIGGPHIGINYIWPMSIIARALTSSNDTEIIYCLGMLKASSAGSGWLHESFNKDNVQDFTRPWFAWVNGLFGQLVLKLAQERPHLIFNQMEAPAAAATAVKPASHIRTRLQSV